MWDQTQSASRAQKRRCSGGAFHKPIPEHTSASTPDAIMIVLAGPFQANTRAYTGTSPVLSQKRTGTVEGTTKNNTEDTHSVSPANSSKRRPFAATAGATAIMWDWPSLRHSLSLSLSSAHRGINLPFHLNGRLSSHAPPFGSAPQNLQKHTVGSSSMLSSTFSVEKPCSQISRRCGFTFESTTLLGQPKILESQGFPQTGARRQGLDTCCSFPCRSKRP